MPKGDEIGPNESARMIVRGVLFDATPEIRGKYAGFVFPLTLDPGGGVQYDLVSKEENENLAEFVNQLSQVTVIDEAELNKIPALNMRIEKVKAQVQDVLKIAEKFINTFDYYAENLKTITANIRSRKIVDHGDILKLQQGTNLERDPNNEPDVLSWREKNNKVDDEGEKQYFRESFVKALHENKNQGTGPTKLNDVSIDMDNTDLDDFLNDEPEQNNSPKLKK